MWGFNFEHGGVSSKMGLEYSELYLYIYMDYGGGNR